MGRQVNFFLGPADQFGFESSLRSVGDFVVLPSRSASPNPSPLTSTLVEKIGGEALRVLLVRAEDARGLRYGPISGRSEYAPDVVRDPIVEFDRCFVSDAFIRPGRLYYVPSYFDDADRKLHKPKPFLDWADRLLRKARDSLGSKVDDIAYAGVDALKLQAAGVELRRHG